MSISISRATEEDIIDLDHVRAAAYTGSKLHEMFLPNPINQDQTTEYRAHQLQTMKKRFIMPDRHYFKAVEQPSGKMVGFACWREPPLQTEQQGDATGGEPMPTIPEMPAFARMDVIEGIEAKLQEAKTQVMGERKDFWYVQAVCVLPECQGRGIGDQLVKQGLRDLVDKSGLDCYLEASPMAARLYERNGFGREVPIPLGEDGSYVVMTMLRKSSTGGR